MRVRARLDRLPLESFHGLARTMWWPVLAATGLVAGLAALLSAGRPAREAPAARLLVQLPAPVMWIAATSGALALLLFFALALLRDGRRRENEDEDLERETPLARLPAWLRPIIAALALLPYVLLAYVIWTGGVPEVLAHLAERIARLTALVAAPGASGDERPVVSSPVFTGAVAVLVLLAGLGSLGLLLCITFAERLARWWADRSPDDETAPFVEAVEDSLDDLRLADDPRRAIITCYRRFEMALARSRMPRAPWHTPLEFMREALRRLPLPPAAVQSLTRLFELSRFSREPLGPADRDAAVAALLEIQASLTPGRSRAD